jgi:hypothetical protein
VTPSEVCDAVFGVETRDVPLPKWMGGTLPRPWEQLFDGPKPPWYVDPFVTPVATPNIGGFWHRMIFG